MRRCCEPAGRRGHARGAARASSDSSARPHRRPSRRRRARPSIRRRPSGAWRAAGGGPPTMDGCGSGAGGKTGRASEVGVAERVLAMVRKRRSASNCRRRQLSSGGTGCSPLRIWNSGVCRDLQGRRFERCGLMDFATLRGIGAERATSGGDIGKGIFDKCIISRDAFSSKPNRAQSLVFGLQLLKASVIWRNMLLVQVSCQYDKVV